MKAILTGIALASLLSTEASAVTLKFHVSADNGTRFSFLLPKSVRAERVFPIDGNPNLGSFSVFDIDATNSSSNSQVIDIALGNAPGQSRLNVVNNREIFPVFLRFAPLEFRGSAPVLFKGTVANPTFLLGTFRFEGRLPSQGIGALDAGTVQISAVPEPATWLSLIAGFGLAGGALSYRRRTSYTLAVEAPTIPR